jgi:hypothetical protein
VLLARREPDHIARPNFFDWAAFALCPTKTGGDDQSLAERVRMPRRASAGFKCDTCSTDASRRRCLKQGINSHRAGEPIGWSFGRRLCTYSLNFHMKSLSKPEQPYFDWKQPIMQLDGLEICHPIAVIAQVVALEPALSSLVKIKPVFSLSSFSLFPPAVIKFFRIQH